MTVKNNITPEQQLTHHLAYLQLPYARNHCEDLAQAGRRETLVLPVQYLSTLIQGQADQRQDRAIQRRIKLARFPFLKTLDQFNGRPGRKKSIDCRSKISFASSSAKITPMSFSSAVSASAKPISASLWAMPPA